MTTLDPRGLEEAARVKCRQDEEQMLLPDWDDLDGDQQAALRGEAEQIITAYLEHAQPVVNTVEELEGLEGLPVGTVVLDSHQEELVNLPEGWYCIAHNEMALPHEDIALPARVIWRPHESA